MNKFWLHGGEILTPSESRCADLLISDGCVQVIGSAAECKAAPETIELTDCFVTPGLFDLQVNGGATCNFWDDPEIGDVRTFCKQLLDHGVTAFLPTLITAEIAHLKKNIGLLDFLVNPATAKVDMQSPEVNMCVPGIHLEGPFLSPAKPGVHPVQHIRAVNKAELEALLTPSVKLMTIAPEEGDGQEAVRYLQEQNVVVSLGHSNATFVEAQRAFASGIKLMTHTFNALPTMHHRQPGAVAAALLDPEVYCCVIADGLHVDPEMVRLLIRIKGVDRVILVTDIAHVGTTGGELVGSSIFLSEAVQNVVKWGCASFSEAIRMASLNPAKAMNLAAEIGTIAVGRRADLVVWNKHTLSVKMVFVAGRVHVPNRCP